MNPFTPLLLAAAVTAAPAVHAFELTSNDIHAGQPMPKAQEYKGFGCDGENLSPQLAWNGAPEATQSFALTVYDPDAPTGSGWWHWVLYNIPVATRELPANAGDPAALLAPAGAVQGRTDYGSHGFGGACPPKGDQPHHYRFRLFALDVDHLDLPAEASAALVGFMLNQHKLGVAELTATYQR
ncbi:YbhB/YbcL family Raf kinase inhibitor-like protein [Endothiovibrio diazotrophicus]